MITRTVLLYGESLLLALVAASLEQSPNVCVSQAATWPEASQLLVERMPDVLIFDLTDVSESDILPLLLENPHLVLIGLDTESNHAVLVSGHEARSLTLDWIRNIVQGERDYGV